ncbi:MAG: ABC transporter substrate-binding protein [Vicinamibacterales bacterium]
MTGLLRFYALAAGLICVSACVVDRDIPAGGARAATITIAAGADNSPSGAFQARLGVYPLNANVAETLTRMNAEFRVEPQLATRWEYRGNNTWRFHLRANVFFHNRQRLTSRAVVETMARVGRTKGGYGGIGERSAQVVDDSTVDITPTSPNLHLPQQLTHPNYSVFAAGTDPARLPVGTGPFKWVEYRPYDRIVIDRNPYYRNRVNGPARIIFRFIPDANTRALSLLSGEVDLAMDLPREQIGALSRTRGYVIARAPVGQAVALEVNAHGNGTHDLLRDRRLRRAVAYSVDAKELIRGVWSNEARPLHTMTVPAILGQYAGLVHGIPFDTAAAKRLLDEAGWPAGADGIRRRRDGRALQLEMVATVTLEPSAGEMLQAQLRRVGIDLRVTRLPDAASHSARVGAGAFDLNMGASNQNDGDPMFLPALLYYSKSGGTFRRWYSAGARFDSVVEAGLATSDPLEMQRLAAEAIKVAVDEEAVCIPVAALFRIYGLSSAISGFQPHPSQTHQSWATLARH